MLIHLDTSVLVDAFTGTRRAMGQLRAATQNGDETGFSTLVLYEWLRGPRTLAERQAVDAFFPPESIVDFGVREAARAADLYRRLKRPRTRQADLAIAACAIDHGARLWTLNRNDFTDISGLVLYSPKE